MVKQFHKVSPLTEASFYILLAFKTSNHGYGVIKRVQEMTNGRLNLAAGTLYGVINAFLKQKLIVLETEGGSRSKKTYCVSQLGLELLEYETSRLREMVSNSMEVK